MEKLSFDSLHNTRRVFLSKYGKFSQVMLSGQNKVLLSAPHGVQQFRLGKRKPCEIGSLATALFLKKDTNSFLIAKTSCHFDDANFDEKSDYKNIIKKTIAQNSIKYFVDIHGLAKKRACDINLCIHLGKNIESNIPAFERLHKLLQNNNFLVWIDAPFMAGHQTLSSFAKRSCKNIFSIQIEINSSITNQRNNFEKYKNLLQIISSWINSLT